MSTNLTTKTKAEALNAINNALVLETSSVLVDNITISVGKLEAIPLNQLSSIPWNDLRYLVKNLDVAVLSHEVEGRLVTQWEEATQRLIVSWTSTTHTESISEVTDIPTTTEAIQENSVIVQEVEISSSSNADVLLVSKELIEVNKQLQVFVATYNADRKLVKIPVDTSVQELVTTIKPWLVATDKLTDFRQQLKTTKHNSLVLYLYPAYEWEIREVNRKKNITLQESFLEETKEVRELNGWGKYSEELFEHLYKNWDRHEYSQALKIKESVQDNGTFHLKNKEIVEVSFNPTKKDISSQYISRITNRAGSIEERKKKDAVPVLGSLTEISPILVDKIYLAQSYILFNPKTLEFSREVSKIAIQKDGKFYYFNDLEEEERDFHGINPLVKEVSGKEIFPDMGIEKVAFDSLNEDGEILKVECYEKLTSEKIAVDLVTPNNLPFLKKTPNGQLISKYESLLTPVNFPGFIHPNLKPKESLRNEDGTFAISQEPQKSAAPKKARLANLSDARLVAQNSLDWVGFIANVPCKVSLVNSKDHWQLEALPISEIPIYPLLYCLANKAIEGYWRDEDLDTLIIQPLEKEVKRIEEIAQNSQDANKIEVISRRVTNLQRLRKSVLNHEKLEPKIVAECAKIVKEAMEKASCKPSIKDSYYSRYILGKVYFILRHEEGMTYLLDDYMSHKRMSTQVISALRWLNLIPNNLKKEFPKQKPSVKELKSYLYPKFNDKFNSEYKGLSLDIREEKGKTLIDVSHLGKVQVTQVLTAKMPATEGKNRGKVSTKVNATLNFSERGVFEKFLRTKDGRFVSQAMNQLDKLVNTFLSRNYNTLIGEEKVGNQRKVAEIIGFERSPLGWSQIKNNFIKYLTPFSSDSAVDKGKLIYLNTNKVLSKQDLEALVIKIAENWSNWYRKNQEYIKIGNSQGLNRDPQSLIWVFTQKILSGDYLLDKLAWQDTLNWVAEITKLPMGFRTEKGVILTPDCIYSSDVDKYTHRIKVQLIDLLLSSNTGNIESWLQKSPDYLYSALEKVKANWEDNEYILDHLEELHNQLNISLQVEESKY